eukprot:g524.t1
MGIQRSSEIPPAAAVTSTAEWGIETNPSGLGCLNSPTSEAKSEGSKGTCEKLHRGGPTQDEGEPAAKRRRRVSLLIASSNGGTTPEGKTFLPNKTASGVVKQPVADDAFPECKTEKTEVDDMHDADAKIAGCARAGGGYTPVGAKNSTDTDTTTPLRNCSLSFQQESTCRLSKAARGGSSVFHFEQLHQHLARVLRVTNVPARVSASHLTDWLSVHAANLSGEISFDRTQQTAHIAFRNVGFALAAGSALCGTTAPCQAFEDESEEGDSPSRAGRMYYRNHGTCLCSPRRGGGRATTKEKMPKMEIEGPFLKFSQPSTTSKEGEGPVRGRTGIKGKGTGKAGAICGKAAANHAKGVTLAAAGASSTTSKGARDKFYHRVDSGCKNSPAEGPTCAKGKIMSSSFDSSAAKGAPPPSERQAQTRSPYKNPRKKPFTVPETPLAPPGDWEGLLERHKLYDHLVQLAHSKGIPKAAVDELLFLHLRGGGAGDHILKELLEPGPIVPSRSNSSSSCSSPALSPAVGPLQIGRGKGARDPPTAKELGVLEMSKKIVEQAIASLLKGGLSALYDNDQQGGGKGQYLVPQQGSTSTIMVPQLNQQLNAAFISRKKGGKPPHGGGRNYGYGHHHKGGPGIGYGGRPESGQRGKMGKGYGWKDGHKHGVFDNLYAHEVVSIVNTYFVPSPYPQTSDTLKETCRAIVAAAHEKSGADGKNSISTTPIGYGGKIDDTSCVIGEVVEYTKFHADLIHRTRRQQKMRKVKNCLQVACFPVRAWGAGDGGRERSKVDQAEEVVDRSENSAGNGYGYGSSSSSSAGYGYRDSYGGYGDYSSGGAGAAAAPSAPGGYNYNSSYSSVDYGYGIGTTYGGYATTYEYTDPFATYQNPWATYSSPFDQQEQDGGKYKSSYGGLDGGVGKLQPVQEDEEEAEAPSRCSIM